MDVHVPSLNNQEISFIHVWQWFIFNHVGAYGALLRVVEVKVILNAW